MLRPPQTASSRQAAPDPLVALNVLLLSVLAAGLLIAGVLAVYDWKTPGAEAPLVFWMAVIAGAVIILDVILLSLRHVRRLRLGL